MKYWTTDEPKGSPFWEKPRDPEATGWLYTRIGDLRRYLNEHPEVPGAYRWHSAYGDMDVEFQPREMILAKGGGQRARRGHTTRWGRARGMGW